MKPAKGLILYAAGLLLAAPVAWAAGPAMPPGATPAPAPLSLESAISVPTAVSDDGELVLLLLPGLRGFELADTRTGGRAIVSETPCTGYFATISPDKKYVCFKEFQRAGVRLLQVPSLYEVATRKTIALSKPAPVAGNPVVSSRGQIAFTFDRRLVVLRPDFSQALDVELPSAANTLAFSLDGQRLAFGDADERISWLDLRTLKKHTLPFATLHGYQPRFSPRGLTLLARSSGGEISGLNLANGRSRNFGRAESAAWLDEDTVALVRKEVADFAVRHTRVLKERLSSGAAATVLNRSGDAAIALNRSALVYAAPDSMGVADMRTGAPRSATLQSRSPPALTVDAALTAPAGPSAAVASPRVVRTNSTTVQLLGVPYINQLYDSADSFPGGGSCCNATASLMAIQYYGRLPTYPMTCTRGGTHTSYYGFYITSIYTCNGHTFNVPSSSVWGSSLAGYYGGFGYFLQDSTDDSLLHSTRLSEWIAAHNLSAGTDDSVSFAKLQAEINSNYPVVVLNSLTSAGHYITCIGYFLNQHTLLFNDPYGNQAISYPGWQGAGAIYDWPGYNNGYPNLNTVWRYIYARGTGASPGNYWDRNGPVSGAGSAPAGTWDNTSTNWSCDVHGAVATGPWVGQNAIFSAGTDATGTYTVTVSGTQPVTGLFVQRGNVTFTGGQLNFLALTSYFTNYVAAGCTAIFNTPFGGGGSPDKWGPGTAVYSGASTSTGYYTLNEGALAFGNNSALSTARLDVGDPSGANVVTLKSADSNARTLANYLRFLAINVIVGPGGDLTFSGPVQLGANSSPAVSLSVSNSTTTFSGTLTNTGGLQKKGPGTLVLGGASPNTYGSTNANGTTTVNAGILKLSKTAGVAAVPNGALTLNSGGTLLLAAANQIGDSVSLTLNGGTFQSAGFAETLGTLRVSANSTLDLGSGSSILKFAASSVVSWTGGALLTISNWNGSLRGGGAEQVVFDSSSSALNSTQLSQIRFANPPGFPVGLYPAAILTTGEVVPFTAPPAVTCQPLSQVALVGKDVTFSGAATGTPPPAFQWLCCGTNLPMSTAATLTLPRVAINQAGTYCFTATNLAGITNSSSVTLAVYNTACPILNSLSLAANGRFQFTVAGVPGYNYQVLTSTNLANWFPAQTNLSPFIFADTNACPKRFYRVQYLP